jgi:hypothetical protein
MAAPTVITFGGFQRARKGAKKIWRKFPTNGSALISPIVVFGSTNAFATNAVMNTFTGSDMVTIGIAMMPSAVHRRSERRRSALCWSAAVRVVVAFTRFLRCKNLTRQEPKPMADTRARVAQVAETRRSKPLRLCASARFYPARFSRDFGRKRRA